MSTKKILSESKTIEAGVSDIDVPRQYLIAFYRAQIFESTLTHLLSYLISTVRIMVLKEGKGTIDYSPKLPNPDKITLNEIHKRLKTYLHHKRYEPLKNSIGNAIQARNNFIHKSFNSREKTFSVTDELFYQNGNSKKSMEMWNKAYEESLTELLIINPELEKLKHI